MVPKFVTLLIFLATTVFLVDANSSTRCSSMFALRSKVSLEQSASAIHKALQSGLQNNAEQALLVAVGLNPKANLAEIFNAVHEAVNFESGLQNRAQKAFLIAVALGAQ